MKIVNVISVLLIISAAFSYLNYRFIRLPTTIGIMVIALGFSLGLIVLGPHAGFVESEFDSMLHTIRFDDTVLHGILGLLLFAGALHVDFSELRKQKWVVGILATVSVLMSTFVVGFFAYWILGMFGLEIPLLYCLAFGALISPTDPIAVLGILKQVHVPNSLEAKILGESLFNDGMAVVTFLTLIRLIHGGADLAPASVVLTFIQETVGGLLMGFTLGTLCHWMLNGMRDAKIAVLITLAIAMGGYNLADYVHVSAPIMVVVAGLLIGNKARFAAEMESSREYLDTFWELVDEILNAILFVLIGLEVLVVHFGVELLVASLLIIPLVLLARLLSVGLPIGVMRRYRHFTPGAVTVLTWSGLRGGVSIALALTLPLGQDRDVIVAITYIVVIFSILVQGLTIGRVIRRAIHAPS